MDRQTSDAVDVKNLEVAVTGCGCFSADIVAEEDRSD